MNVRTVCGASALLAIALVACADRESAPAGSDLRDDPREQTTKSVDAELSVTPSESSATLTLGSGDSACASFRSTLEGHLEELKALCPEGEVAIPRSIDAEGCSAGEVKSITFGCFKLPPPPPPTPGPGLCRPFAVKDEGGALPEAVRAHGPDLAGLLCPRIGLDLPPPDKAIPPPLPAPPAGKPSAPNGPVPDGPLPPAPPPAPPRLMCCAPPPPPASKAPPAPPAPPPAPAQSE